jgi:cytochrome P450
MPTTIMGAVPHAVTKDDEYMGYLILKGAGVVNNAYTINMDPTRAPNPRIFDPERYADDFLSLGESAAQNDASKRDQFTFGAGRRICPGIHVAERSLFIAISRILWAFDITPKIAVISPRLIVTAKRSCVILEALGSTSLEELLEAGIPQSVGLLGRTVPRAGGVLG